MIDFSYYLPENTPVQGFMPETHLDSVSQAYQEVLHHNMSGWLELPILAPEELSDLKETARKIQSDSDYLVCIGIGGSFLGHKAIIDALSFNQSSPSSKTKILYAGNSLDPYTLQAVLAQIGPADYSINVISKSGTTLEPAVAFEFFKEKLSEKYGDDFKSRIYVTTDANTGTLHDEAVQYGYHRFIIPDNVGGRYSVLTAVGLLPLAVAGVDIDKLLDGAQKELQLSSSKSSAFTYAALRQHFAANNYDVEVLASFASNLNTFNEWWKQLFGESEGKEGQGIFPASVIYTTDLHSLGQYLQQGRRNIFETFITIKHPESPVPLENLKFTSAHHKTMVELNQIAEQATIKAHQSGGIPVLKVEIEKLDAYNLGALLGFFELSCALSATLQGVSPFNQPGVEEYKNNMRELMS